MATDTEKLAALLLDLKHVEDFFKIIGKIPMNKFPREAGVHQGYLECAKWVKKTRRKYE